MPSNFSPSSPQQLAIKSFDFSLAQNAGTYTIATASGGGVYVEVASVFTRVAGVGFTSFLLETNHGAAAKSIVASLIVASATIDSQLTIVTSSFVLPSTKLIRGTIVGNGSAGLVRIVTKWAPIDVGALLS